MKTGARLIAAERRRQVKVERWTAKHDEQHEHIKLTGAAVSYAIPKHWWELNHIWWKPSQDKIRNLVKAGATIPAAKTRGKGE